VQHDGDVIAADCARFKLCRSRGCATRISRPDFGTSQADKISGFGRNAPGRSFHPLSAWLHRVPGRNGNRPPAPFAPLLEQTL